MSEPEKKTNPLNALAGIGGAIGGWSLSEYCGVSIWIPGVAVILFLMLFAKTPIRPKYFKGAIATTGAHLTWFLVGSVLAGLWSATVLDIVALTIGIIWLWVRPGLLAALFLGLIQGASLAVNAYSISLVPFGSAQHRALTVHCVFRLLALICLIVGYIRLRRERSTPLPVSGMAMP